MASLRRLGRLAADLAAAEARYRSVLESATEAIILMTLDGMIVEVNPAAAELVGLTREQAQGKDVLQFVTPEERGHVADQLRRQRDGVVQRTSYVTQVLRTGGERVEVEVNSTLVRDADEPRILVVARDMSEFRELQERLGQVQRLESVGRLAGAVAHDFNNLLTAIEGYSQFAIDALPPEETGVRENLDEVLNAARRAANLTRSLLAFSRRQILQPRVFDLAPIVEDMHRLLRRLIGAQIELTVRAEGPAHVLADPGQLEQVLVNLVLNARDAMASGGRAEIEVGTIELDAGQARPLELEPGRYVRLAVTDTGSGMDEQTKARLFEPFFTTKRPGTGMGLATAYGVVRQSGGAIAVDSEEREGTCVAIFLPYVEQPAAADGRAEGSERLLVVEDEEIVRNLLERMLTGLGYDVRVAANGSEALRLAREDAHFDLLLTDVVMPGMNGRELAARVTEVSPGTKVLYMSGYTEEEILLRGDADQDLVEKPFTAEELGGRIRGMLDAAA